MPGYTSNLTIAAGGTVDMDGYTQSAGALNTEAGRQLLVDGSLNITSTQRTPDETAGGSVDVNALYGAGELHIADSRVYVNKAQSGFTGNVILDGGAILFLNSAKGFNAESLHLSHVDDTLIFGNESHFNAAWTSIPRGNHDTSTSGIGNVSVQDSSDVNFTADNSDFSGRFLIDATSVLRASQANNLGSASIDNAGTAVLTANSNWDITNTVTGDGTLSKDGSATLRADQALAAFSGTTQMKAGTLAFGDTSPSVGGNIGGNVIVDNDAVLFGHGSIAGGLNNADTVRLSGDSGAVLAVAGNYMSNGGSLYLNTVLGDSQSLTYRLVAGSVSLGPDGATRLYVNNVGGLGAQTTGNDIEVIHVNGGAGASAAGAFALGDHVKAGGYQYSLYHQGRNGLGGMNGNWYLRSANDNQSDPYRPEVPAYMVSSALASKFGLALLSTWNERSGAYASANTSGSSEAAHGQRMWGRLFGESGDVDFGGSGIANHVNEFEAHGPSYDYDLTGIQAGVDVYRGEHADGAQETVGMYVGAGRASATVDRAGILHDFGAEGKTTFNTPDGQNPVTLKTDLGGTQGQIGLGVSGQISSNVSLFGGADYSFAVDQGDGSSLGGRVGVNVSW